LDELSNKLVKIKKNSSSFNYNKVEVSIQNCVGKIRGIKYGNYDSSQMILVECFKLVRGVSYFEDVEYTMFGFPRTSIQPWIKYSDNFSFKELMKVSSNLAAPLLRSLDELVMGIITTINQHGFTLENGKDKLLEAIYKVYGDYNDVQELKECEGKVLPYLVDNVSDMVEKGREKGSEESSAGVKKVKGKSSGVEKALRRFYIYIPEKVSVTRKRLYTIIAHLTQADFSLLSDFDVIKEELSIVNNSFVTLGKPIKFEDRNVHVRDTMLLAPGSSKSLDSIGKLYGDEYNKIKISQDDLESMHLYLARDLEGFTSYAIRDAVISLIHAAWMEDFGFKLGSVGVPISLSSIGRKYVKAIWKEMGYSGYQISGKYLLGDVSRSMTPKGLQALGDVGFVLPYYIANYKGGRNECFMYGVDNSKELWCDYDLTSAYTSVMSMAGHPDYESCHRLTVDELLKMSKKDVLYSYLIIRADFEFPALTKYPSIPCYVDETCTVYPLQGSCVITGAEYLLALSQKCRFNYSEIYLIPFTNSEHKDSKPFSKVLSLVQEQRREHSKGSISNLMYKEIGNSIYGSVVRGIGDKRKFDIKSKGTVRMVGDDLTNPLIASWTTAFVRSLIGECLHSINLLGGKVVSVTTDGFITNVLELESKISSGFLLTEYKQIRNDLSGDNTGLEVKSFGCGVMAWSTRGQIGYESKILATTGFQHRPYSNKQKLYKILESVLKSDNKTVEYIQGSLRSAREIYKKGGHVTMKYRDQLFRLHFDNRRVLNWESTIPSTVECLVDSEPVVCVKSGECLRFIGSLSKKKLFGKYTSSSGSNKYKSSVEIAARNFVKGVLASPPLFNLPSECFKTRDDLRKFVQGYKSEIGISLETMSRYKSRDVKLGLVQKTKETQRFVDYVRVAFPNFDEGLFYLQSK
jgi:hypothetical protein